MVVRVNLQSKRYQLLYLGTGALLYFSLLWFGLLKFVTSVAADPAAPVGQAYLEAAAAYFPNSARLQTRVASRLIEAGPSSHQPDLEQSHEELTKQALGKAERAVALAPRNYETWLLRAVAREWAGDMAGSEADLRQAVELAPARVETRWRLANLLVRSDKLMAALPELQFVLKGAPARLPAVLSLVWEASGGDLNTMQAIVPDDAPAKTRFTLAHFLARQDQPQARLTASALWDKFGTDFLRETPEARLWLDEWLAGGDIVAARQRWNKLWPHAPQANLDSLWNPGFETAPSQGLTQFDWQIASSSYAQLSILPGQTHEGQYALRVTYQDKNTTRLNGELQQVVVVQPGVTYRFKCWAKAEQLITPNSSLQLAAYSFPGKSNGQSPALLALSPALRNGSYDWQSWETTLAVQSGVQAIRLTLQQTPAYSYTETSRGTVWLDDCSLTKQE